MHIHLFSSGALTGLPAVSVRPWFGASLPASMMQTGQSSYEGTVDIGDSAAGNVEVLAVGPGGQTATVAGFHIQELPAAQSVRIIGPDGRFDVNLTRDGVNTNTHVVTANSGNKPIPVSDPLLVSLVEPVSFHLQGGMPAESISALNWRLPAEALAGRDVNTLSLRRFDTTAGDWMDVSASFMPSLGVVSATGVTDGIYAVFARESTDTSPPAPIADLTAATGGEGWSVVLNWTAPGDDGSWGQAVRYRVLFSTKPVTQANVDQWLELRLPDSPRIGGQPESHVFQMPDPDTLYYFAVVAVDEAGNQGPLSNIVSARSYVQDTDGDGLSDQWEQAYGFAPSSPGDEVLDPDGDGLPNLQEYRLHTLPIIWDSDGDGLSDMATFPDLDNDGTVDAIDLGVFEACATGPGVSYEPAGPPAGCPLVVGSRGLLSADLDGDGDIDQSDFGVLQRSLGK